MTEAYLLLLNHFKNDDIYVNHNAGGFKVRVNGKEEYINKSEVKKFITTFVDNKTIKDGK